MHWWERFRYSIAEADGFGWVAALNTWEDLATEPVGAEREADVRAEVRDSIRILGAKGGYILGPCHNIQPITPPDLIVAMYEEAYEVGWR